ncbi:AAA family ATPase [Kitasatospora sp. NBC_01287]|uniref:AAA family ATPase n=1 Tax=Kitasatospora sp. NBC_01287 TaxID=2903573 RepID=UPI002259FB7B|nr:AAA family ATPase [Kitasatospora sp. NBC_01287]MCX4745335.1 AAA family ATPase [Kitasatospora sp. NBC_01287]
MHRYILTGTPGAGKTSILGELAALGNHTVAEAATDVITAEQARGEPEPWTRDDFVEQVTALQRDRQLRAPVAGPGLQLYDRSPVCTHALSVFQGRPVPPGLAAELARIVQERIYRPQVLFVRQLGFCEPTAARRISFADALEFERVHEESYRAFGFELVEIPPGPLAERVARVRGVLAELSGLRERSGLPGWRGPGAWGRS